MAEFVKGGTSRSARTSSASTRPRACARGTSSAASGAIRSRIRSRACATVSTGAADLSIVPVAVFELGRAALAVGDDVLVEPGSDHLVRHRTRNPQLREGLDLVGHDLVAGGFDGRDHIIDRRAGLWPTAPVFGSGHLRRDLSLRLLGSFRLAVFCLFGHGMLHLNTGIRAQADTVRLAGPRLACTRSITKRNVSLATAVTGAARNIPIKPNSDAPSSVLKIKSRGCTFVKRPRMRGATRWLSTCWATSAKIPTTSGSGLPAGLWASASRTASVPQISGPKNGIASMKNAIVPTSSAAFSPITRRPTVTTTPMNRLMIN